MTAIADTPIAPQTLDDVAVVIIGRNEGERLRRALASVIGEAALVVYVDSGSTDGSVPLARSLGAHVVDLDMSMPFTAARARNAGFDAVMRLAHPVAYVQFADGDCEIEQGWLATARNFLADNPGFAVAFGRRRELHPEQSLYNRLCDLEWDVPPGETRSCAGDAMMRASALDAAGGYRADLIAGEEPELCVRLRRSGWRIMCLQHPMTRHDAAITRFSQWWRRTMRGGYAFAQGAHLHGLPPERHWVAESRRAWIWGAGIPAAIGAATLAFGPWGLLTALVYPAQVARLYLNRRRAMAPMPLASSIFHVLGKFPEGVGQMKFFRDLWTGRTGHLIEYK